MILATVNTMRKYFGLTVALMPLMAEAALSPSLSQGTQTLAVTTLDNNQPVCYMRTTDGRTLDLSQLCGQASVKPETHQTSRKYRHH